MALYDNLFGLMDLQAAQVSYPPPPTQTSSEHHMKACENACHQQEQGGKGGFPCRDKGFQGPVTKKLTQTLEAVFLLSALFILGLGGIQG